MLPRSTSVVRGQLVVRLMRDGVVVKESRVRNTVTSAGKTLLADQISGRLQAPIGFMAIGTGTPGSTALGAELKRTNIQTKSSSGAVATFVAQWSVDDHFSGTLTEAGLFNADTGFGGTMLCSAVISPSIVKALADSISITWTLTFP